MLEEDVRREPLTPRNRAAESLSTKGGTKAHDSTSSLAARKLPAAARVHAFEMEENNPNIAQEPPAGRGDAKQPCEAAASSGCLELWTNDQMSKADCEYANSVRDLTRRQADLEMREYQVCRTQTKIPMRRICFLTLGRDERASRGLQA
jgi:hypothetical protein